MLSAHHITKTYGIHTVLQDITFSLNAGERLGLIGPNGCGKTTLMRLLAGQEQPDSGKVMHTHPGLRIGYFAQGLDINPEITVAEAYAINSSLDKDAELVTLSTALAHNPFDKNLHVAYDRALSRLSTITLRPEEVLLPLGLSEISPDTKVASLSGGQKTRLMLARLLLSEPNLLLLDEPTSHLDIGMLEWLEGWLADFSGAALIVSHDRAFLDHTVSSILDLDPETHTLRRYAGNYSAFIEQKLAERQLQAQAFADQQTEIAEIKAAAAHLRGLAKFRKGGKADTNDGFAKGFFANRGKGTVGRAKHIERHIEQILTEEKIEKPRPSWQLKLDFAAPDHQSRDILVTGNLSIGYPGYAPLLENLHLHIRAGQRIAMTGPNGCGKTTLLRTVIGKMEPLSGTVRLGSSARTGYMTQEQEHLDLKKSPLETIQGTGMFNETEARHFLHFFLFSGDDPLRPAGSMSYGERARLELALLVAQGYTFLLLDEPINHLDIPSRVRFEQALTKYSGTVLAVVHDRYFIEQFASAVWVVENGRIRAI